MRGIGVSKAYTMVPRALTDKQADAACVIFSVTDWWLSNGSFQKGSQLTVNREKMKARYKALVKFIEVYKDGAR